MTAKSKYNNNKSLKKLSLESNKTKDESGEILYSNVRFLKLYMFYI